MRFIKIRSFIFWILLCLYNYVYAQEEIVQTPDSLKEKSYKYLFDRFNQHINDTLASELYLNAYLHKASVTHDGVNKSLALTLLSDYAINDESKLKLIEESIIESNRVDSSFSVSPYNALGTYYYKRYDYDKAFQQFSKVLRLSRKNDDKVFEMYALHNIALIKSEVGQNKAALALYKKCFFLESRIAGINSGSVVGSSLSLSESFRYNKQYDSASYYYKKVIDLVRQEYTFLLEKALINEGINLYYKGSDKQAETLLIEGVSQATINSKYYILANYYLGKLSQKYQKSNANQYFLKVDSLLTKNDIVIPEIGDVYADLITHYKEINDHEKQLYFLNKLVRFNEVAAIRTIKVSDRIHAEFDTPRLLKTRDELIKNLKVKNQYLTSEKIILVLLLLLVVVLLSLQYLKHKKYKQRFKNILEEVDNQGKHQKKVGDATSITKLTIDSQLVKDILSRLEVFESKKGFLKNTVTITVLARKLSTNTKYLSKIINTYKGKTFISYINDLRIDYVLKELQINYTLQQYTLLGIAEEIGFNSADSFSTAFKKKTGISPSYYIKNLKSIKKEKVMS